MTIDRLLELAQDLTMNRYRVTVIAHRSSGVGATPLAGGSGILHSEVVRAESAVFARDLVLVRVVAASARVADVPVGVDTVTVERLRLGRPAVRVSLSERARSNPGHPLNPLRSQPRRGREGLRPRRAGPSTSTWRGAGPRTRSTPSSPTRATW